MIVKESLSNKVTQRTEGNKMENRVDIEGMISATIVNVPAGNVKNSRPICA